MHLLAHDRSDRAAHGGRLSEHFHFEAGAGSQFFVSYALPKVPVIGDLNVSLHVRSNRSGVQLFGRVVLPADIDPETKSPSFVMVPGTVFNRVDRWERLELTEILPAIERQARVLRASTQRPVPLEGAYLERVVVNLMGGAGDTEVFLDDLLVAPVPHELGAAGPPAGSLKKPAAADRTGQSAPPGGRSASPPIRFSRFFLREVQPGRALRGLVPNRDRCSGASMTELRAPASMSSSRHRGPIASGSRPPWSGGSSCCLA